MKHPVLHSETWRNTILYILSSSFTSQNIFIQSDRRWQICICSSWFSKHIHFWRVLSSGTCFSETSVDFQHTARCYISKNRPLHYHCCGNLKSYTLISVCTLSSTHSQKLKPSCVYYCYCHHHHRHHIYYFFHTFSKFSTNYSASPITILRDTSGDDRSSKKVNWRFQFE
jgi:hypothetical protein